MQKNEQKPDVAEPTPIDRLSASLPTIASEERRPTTALPNTDAKGTPPTPPISDQGPDANAPSPGSGGTKEGSTPPSPTEGKQTLDTKPTEEEAEEPVTDREGRAPNPPPTTEA